MSTSAITRVASMAAVTAVAAQITIAVFPVPFTLQVLAGILSGFLLAPRYGGLAQVIYVLSSGRSARRSSPISRVGSAPPAST